MGGREADGPDRPEGEPARESLSLGVYRGLRTALMGGAYSPGTRLNMRRIASEYGVSQTPIREAVMQLVRDGALEVKLGFQPRVPQLSVTQYVEIREARVPLERLAAELAAARMAEAEVDELARFHAGFAAAEAEGAWTEALAFNQRFHFGVYRASGNGTVLRLIENLWLLIGPFLAHQYPLVRRAHIEHHPHLRLVDALRRRSAAEAGDLVVQDLREGSYLILSALEAQARKLP